MGASPLEPGSRHHHDSHSTAVVLPTPIPPLVDVIPLTAVSDRASETRLAPILPACRDVARSSRRGKPARRPAHTP